MICKLTEHCEKTDDDVLVWISVCLVLNSQTVDSQTTTGLQIRGV